MLMLNYNEEEEQKIILEYGAATRTVVACGFMLSTLVAAYVF